MSKTDNTKPKPKPIIAENTRKALAYLPTLSGKDGNKFRQVLPGPTNKVEVTREDFDLIPPKQWGIMVANEHWRLSNVPDELASLIDAAANEEEKRLGREAAAAQRMRVNREKGEEFR